MKYLVALFVHGSIGCLFHWMLLGTEITGVASIGIIGGWPFIVFFFALVVGLIFTLAVFIIFWILEGLNDLKS